MVKVILGSWSVANILQVAVSKEFCQNYLLGILGFVFIKDLNPNISLEVQVQSLLHQAHLRAKHYSYETIVCVASQENFKMIKNFINANHQHMTLLNPVEISYLESGNKNVSISYIESKNEVYFWPQSL